MIERPDLDDADLTRWVRSAWDLDVMGLRFMPVGLDGWAFAVSTPNCRFFLKVKRESPGRPASLVPRYPYIDGANLWNSGLRDEQWIEYGQLLADMHTGEPPSIVGLRTETFTTTAPARIRTMATAAAHSPYLVGLWAAHGDDILRLDDAALFIASLLDDSLSEATKENELFWLRRILAG